MTRPTAISLVLAGGVLMGMVGLILRLMESADGFQILVIKPRSISLGIFEPPMEKQRVRTTQLYTNTSFKNPRQWSALPIVRPWKMPYN